MRNKFKRILAGRVLPAASVGIAAALIVSFAPATLAGEPPTAVSKGSPQFRTRVVTPDPAVKLHRAAASPALPSAVVGQKVFIDPATRKIREPEPEEASQLSDAVRRMVKESTANLKPVYYPNGTISLDLQGRYLSVAVAQKQPGGGISYQCVHGPAGAPASAGTVAGKAGKTRPQEEPDVQ